MENVKINLDKEKKEGIKMMKMKYRLDNLDEKAVLEILKGESELIKLPETVYVYATNSGSFPIDGREQIYGNMTVFDKKKYDEKMASGETEDLNPIKLKIANYQGEVINGYEGKTIDVSKAVLEFKKNYNKQIESCDLKINLNDIREVK